MTQEKTEELPDLVPIDDLIEDLEFKFFALHTMRERVWLYKRKGELPPYDFCVTCRAKGWLRETLVKFSETPTPRQLKKWGFPENLTPEDFTPEQREEIKNKLTTFQ